MLKENLSYAEIIKGYKDKTSEKVVGTEKEHKVVKCIYDNHIQLILPVIYIILCNTKYIYIEC